MANLWSAFLELLPKTDITTGVVNIVHADGSSTITDPMGNILRVQGDTVAVGVNCYVQGGRIIAEAPALVGYGVEV